MFPYYFSVIFQFQKTTPTSLILFLHLSLFILPFFLPFCLAEEQVEYKWHHVLRWLPYHCRDIYQAVFLNYSPWRKLSAESQASEWGGSSAKQIGSKSKWQKHYGIRGAQILGTKSSLISTSPPPPPPSLPPPLAVNPVHFQTQNVRV